MAYVIDILRKLYGDTIRYVQSNCWSGHQYLSFQPKEIGVDTRIPFEEQDNLRLREGMELEAYRSLMYEAYKQTKEVANDIPIHIILLPIQESREGYGWQRFTVLRRCAIVTVGRELALPAYPHAAVLIDNPVSFWDFLQLPFFRQLEVIALRYMRWRGY